MKGLTSTLGKERRPYMKRLASTLGKARRPDMKRLASTLGKEKRLDMKPLWLHRERKTLPFRSEGEGTCGQVDLALAANGPKVATKDRRAGGGVATFRSDSCIARA